MLAGRPAAGRQAGAAPTAKTRLTAERSTARDTKDPALRERLLDLEVVRGHLGPGLEADLVHLGRAQPARAARRVDRDVAAADHDHALPGEVDGLVELHAAEEVE